MSGSFQPSNILAAFSGILSTFVATRQPRPEHNRNCPTCGKRRPFWRRASGPCNRTCAAIARLKEAA